MKCKKKSLKGRVESFVIWIDDNDFEKHHPTLFNFIFGFIFTLICIFGVMVIAWAIFKMSLTMFILLVIPTVGGISFAMEQKKMR